MMEESKNELFNVLVETVTGKTTTLLMSEHGIEYWKQINETRGGKVLAVNVSMSQVAGRKFHYDDRR